MTSKSTAKFYAGADRSYPSIFEKSATDRVASRISLRSFSRFSRRGLSSTLTVTLSKNASTRGRNLAIATHRCCEIFLGDCRGGFFLCDVYCLRQRLLFGHLVLLCIGRTGVLALIFLLLDTNDVGRALVAGEQILAVIAVEEFSERVNATHDQRQKLAGYERRVIEDGSDKIVTRLLIAQAAP